MNIDISDVNFNSQFSEKLNGHNIHSPLCHHNRFSSFYFIKELIYLVSAFNFQFFISLNNWYSCRIGRLVNVQFFFLWRIDLHIEFSMFHFFEELIRLSVFSIFTSKNNCLSVSIFNFHHIWFDLPCRHIQFSIFPREVIFINFCVFMNWWQNSN